MKLIYDKPETKGVANALKRARQMTDFRWSSVKAIPAVYDFDDMTGVNGTYAGEIRAFFPQTGLIYSSIQETQEFIGFNVSLEAFATALSDPDSVLYKKNLYEHGRINANSWYGTVCSSFVSYVFGVKERWICKRWPVQPGVITLGQPDINDLKLLDIVLNVKVHIAMITGIARDEKGNVQRIEISESTLPVCRRTWFTAEEFRGYWYGREYQIYRKTDTKDIPYEPSPFVRIEADPERGIEADPMLPPYVCNPDILPDRGNGTNYRKDKEIVLDLLSEGWDGAFVTNENGEKAFFAAKDGKVILPTDSPMHAPGFYEAKAVRTASGEESRAVNFCVTGFAITPADGSSCSEMQDAPVTVKPGQKLTLSFENPKKDPAGPVYVFVVKNSAEKARFRTEECRNGQVTITMPEDEGEYFVVQTSENRFGEYSSNKLFYKVVK